MPPLGALTQAWTAAGASLPLGWQVVRMSDGLFELGDPLHG